MARQLDSPVPAAQAQAVDGPIPQSGMRETKRHTVPTSLRLRPADQALLDALVARTGLGPTAVLRLGLREMAARYGLASEQEPEHGRPSED